MQTFWLPATKYSLKYEMKIEFLHLHEEARQSLMCHCNVVHTVREDFCFLVLRRSYQYETFLFKILWHCPYDIYCTSFGIVCTLIAAVFRLGSIFLWSKQTPFSCCMQNKEQFACSDSYTFEKRPTVIALQLYRGWSTVQGEILFNVGSLVF